MHDVGTTLQIKFFFLQQQMRIVLLANTRMWLGLGNKSLWLGLEIVHNRVWLHNLMVNKHRPLGLKSVVVAPIHHLSHPPYLEFCLLNLRCCPAAFAPDHYVIMVTGCKSCQLKSFFVVFWCRRPLPSASIWQLWSETELVLWMDGGHTKSRTVTPASFVHIHFCLWLGLSNKSALFQISRRQSCQQNP